MAEALERLHEADFRPVRSDDQNKEAATKYKYHRWRCAHMA